MYWHWVTFLLKPDITDSYDEKTDDELKSKWVLSEIAAIYTSLCDTHIVKQRRHKVLKEGSFYEFYRKWMKRFAMRPILYNTPLSLRQRSKQQNSLRPKAELGLLQLFNAATMRISLKASVTL